MPSRRPDVLFIKPGSQKQLYGSLSDYDLTAIEPPLWAGILGGYLRGLGYGVEILDAETDGLGWNEVAQAAVDRGALLTVVMASGHNPSASTMNMTGVGAIARRIKELAPQAALALTGLHLSALPERSLREEAADFVIQGEGLRTLPPLIDALKAKADAFAGIPGLWWRQDGHIMPGIMPEMWKDLDTLPMPAWDLLPMERYRAHNWHCFDDVTRRQPYATLYTSLGCPYQCSFCCINALFGEHRLRSRGVDSVLAEIDFLVNTYGVRNIKIMDELFAVNEKRVLELCGKIASRGYDLNFWAYARVNTVSERMLEAMKKAGVNWIAYGFESGSKRVIEDVTKGYQLDKVLRVAQMTYDQGQHICANFIFGLPEDDYDSMQETNALMQEINAEWANIYSAMAYPGSKLYDDAVAQGLPLPATWNGFSQYSRDCLPLPTKYLSGGQVLAFRDYAFDAYYKNPRYLNMIRSKFGEDTMRHIVKMAEKTLDRDNAVI
ncbi:MAG TPA: radical SAM protein [Humidesulfovibrio sp.]|uniref:B12-binding domain-containing radical SAM protein n=1 Tax=Humidesulfovibrio sp. TaxID=2910988 RepID=UPI002C9F5AC5|nr:radical SAM protein [Humidesulfovibrio sp.]HWR03995.1 radical SAM protein [Humidesulfovibrio sp.]